MKERIEKYLNGIADKSEQAVLLAWLRKHENRETFNSHKLDWKKGLDAQQLPDGSENSWTAIQDYLLQKRYDRWQQSEKINRFFKVAAIVFFVMGIGSALYFISNQHADEVFTTVMADNGQISKVILPDSSVVWLNSGSELSYSNLFSKKNRSIELKGEAYFDVTRNEELPLVVSVDEFQVKVLGTRFDVNAYPESSKISVVLEEGKVELLSAVSTSFDCVMKPGEKATFNKNTRKMNVVPTNTARYTSWKDGTIHIYDQTLEELVKRLENRYNQTFVFEDAVKDFPFTFTIENESLAEVIALMEKIAPIKAKQTDDIIAFSLDKRRKREVDR